MREADDGYGHGFISGNVDDSRVVERTGYPVACLPNGCEISLAEGGRPEDTA